jgi:hypothetical protein
MRKLLTFLKAQDPRRGGQGYAHRGTGAPGVRIRSITQIELEAQPIGNFLGSPLKSNRITRRADNTGLPPIGVIFANDDLQTGCADLCSDHISETSCGNAFLDHGKILHSGNDRHRSGQGNLKDQSKNMVYPAARLLPVVSASPLKKDAMRKFTFPETQNPRLAGQGHAGGWPEAREDRARCQAKDPHDPNAVPGFLQAHLLSIGRRLCTTLVLVAEAMSRKWSMPGRPARMASLIATRALSVFITA